MSDRTTDDVEDQVPPETTAAWLRGEEQLYLAALSSVEVYQAAMELVRLTVEHLRTLGAGTAGLLAAAARGPELVPPVRRPVHSAVLPLGLVAEAALALRHREVVAEQAARRRVAALAAARSRGDVRVVLETSGDPAGDPFRPYRRLEADVATGRALLVTTVPDGDFRGCVHVVEALQVDLATGALRAPRGVDMPTTSHADVQAREQHVAKLWAGTPG